MNMPLPASFLHALRQWWLSVYRRISLVEPRLLVIAAALVVIGLSRALPASYLQGMDNIVGRPGDTVLLLAVLLIVVSHLLLHWSRPRLPQSRKLEPVEAMFKNHLRLDFEIDKRFDEVVGDTENAAMAIIEQVRNLHDGASKLVGYLDGSSTKEQDLKKEIIASVSYVVEVGAFIQRMPAKMERDMGCVQSISKEIRDLAGMVEAVRAISMQSHLLAINGAVEASRAGNSGAAFRVLAEEMRKLASNTREVAISIKDGLGRARDVVEGGLAASIAESTQQLGEVSLAAVSISKLLDNFEDMSEYNQTRFAIVTKHSEDLAKNIAEVLGHIHSQDVVRQHIERIRFAIGKRNDFLQTAISMAVLTDGDLVQLPQALEVILNDYVTEEGKHGHASVSDAGSELKIELF